MARCSNVLLACMIIVATDNLNQLFVNQFVSSTLNWREVGISMTTNITMYAQGACLHVLA